MEMALEQAQSRFTFANCNQAPIFHPHEVDFSELTSPCWILTYRFYCHALSPIFLITETGGESRSPLTSYVKISVKYTHTYTLSLSLPLSPSPWNILSSS